MLSALRASTCIQPTTASIQVPVKPYEQPVETQTGPQLGHTLEDTIIKSRWKLIKVIGKGAFGEVYLAVDLTTKEHVAVKVESPDCKKPVLKLEVAILQKLQASSHVCKIIACGRFISPLSSPVRHDKSSSKDSNDSIYSYLVMELLGSNLSDLRKQLGGKFSIATTALLAKQMLLGIQSAHEIGFLHRDIKPGNFCIASQGSTYIDECRRLRCFLIDFGLSRRYLSSSGKVREARTKVGFRGTARYASISAHCGTELCRVDDLWSLFYIIVEFLTGALPWKGREKEKIGVMKKELTNPQLVAELPQPVLSIYSYLKTLSYEDVPDYKLMLHFLDELFKSSKMPENVQYDWDIKHTGSPTPSTENHSQARPSNDLSSDHQILEKNKTPKLPEQTISPDMTGPETPTTATGKIPFSSIDAAKSCINVPEVTTGNIPYPIKTDPGDLYCVDRLDKIASPTPSYSTNTIQEPIFTRVVRSFSLASSSHQESPTGHFGTSSHTLGDVACQPRWVNNGLLDQSKGVCSTHQLTINSNLKPTVIRSSIERFPLQAHTPQTTSYPVIDSLNKPSVSGISSVAPVVKGESGKAHRKKRSRWWADFSICF
ncbi:hypothetical protein O5D80_002315 [Batrachochytrium dendrobatidis]|nr:hypothetical protein O5D80_002315 [Batrachochytrium dendrobatidis]